MSLVHQFAASLISHGMPEDLSPRVLRYLEIAEGTLCPNKDHLQRQAVHEIVAEATGRTVKGVENFYYAEDGPASHASEAERASFLYRVGLSIGLHSLWPKSMRDNVRDAMTDGLSHDKQKVLLGIAQDHLWTPWKQKLTERLPYLRPCLPEHARHFARNEDGTTILDYPALCATQHFQLMSMLFCACAVRNDRDRMGILERLLCVHVTYPIIGRMRRNTEIVLLLT